MKYNSYGTLGPGRGKSSIIVTFILKVWSLCAPDFSLQIASRQVYVASFVPWNYGRFSFNPPDDYKKV